MEKEALGGRVLKSQIDESLKIEKFLSRKTSLLV